MESPQYNTADFQGFFDSATNNQRRILLNLRRKYIKTRDFIAGKSTDLTPITVQSLIVYLNPVVSSEKQEQTTPPKRLVQAKYYPGNDPQIRWLRRLYEDSGGFLTALDLRRLKQLRKKVSKIQKKQGPAYEALQENRQQKGRLFDIVVGHHRRTKQAVRDPKPVIATLEKRIKRTLDHDIGRVTYETIPQSRGIQAHEVAVYTKEDQSELRLMRYPQTGTIFVVHKRPLFTLPNQSRFTVDEIFTLERGLFCVNRRLGESHHPSTFAIIYKIYPDHAVEKITSPARTAVFHLERLLNAFIPEPASIARTNHITDTPITNAQLKRIKDQGFTT